MALATHDLCAGGRWKDYERASAECASPGLCRTLGCRADVKLTDPSSGNVQAGELFRRGAYLILRSGERTTSYARRGTPLVQSAEQSSEAQTLARAVNGKIFQVSAQTNGRGSFVERTTAIRILREWRDGIRRKRSRVDAWLRASSMERDCRLRVGADAALINFRSLNIRGQTCIAS
jgi:hypothetical protein